MVFSYYFEFLFASIKIGNTEGKRNGFIFNAELINLRIRGNNSIDFIEAVHQW